MRIYAININKATIIFKKLPIVINLSCNFFIILGRPAKITG
ncbi:conserved hypothetical protein [delta proteobacterium NaphS2]|nr:conserved hypothetical protein [delta proteobacterium NaphS2]